MKHSHSSLTQQAVQSVERISDLLNHIICKQSDFPVQLYRVHGEHVEIISMNVFTQLSRSFIDSSRVSVWDWNDSFGTFFYDEKQQIFYELYWAWRSGSKRTHVSPQLTSLQLRMLLWQRCSHSTNQQDKNWQTKHSSSKSSCTWSPTLTAGLNELNSLAVKRSSKDNLVNSLRTHNIWLLDVQLPKLPLNNQLQFRRRFSLSSTWSCFTYFQTRFVFICNCNYFIWFFLGRNTMRLWMSQLKI